MNGGPVILADEPTGALDSQGGKEVMAILEKLHGQGHTIIVVTHDSDIAAYAHRIVRIADGRITSDELQQKGEAAHQAQTGETAKDAKPGVAVLGESLKMALRSLLHNRLRTALTMLGIIIGVASVVALMAIGNGAKQDVLERIQAMGTDLLTIMRGPPAVRASAGIVTSFLPEDLPSIGSVPGVAMAIPETNAVFAAALWRPGLDGHGGRNRRRLSAGARLAAAVRRVLLGGTREALCPGRRARPDRRRRTCSPMTRIRWASTCSLAARLSWSSAC